MFRDLIAAVLLVLTSKAFVIGKRYYMLFQDELLCQGIKVLGGLVSFVLTSQAFTMERELIKRCYYTAYTISADLLVCSNKNTNVS